MRGVSLPVALAVDVLFARPLVEALRQLRHLCSYARRRTALQPPRASIHEQNRAWFAPQRCRHCPRGVSTARRARAQQPPRATNSRAMRHVRAPRIPLVQSICKAPEVMAASQGTRRTRPRQSTHTRHTHTNTHKHTQTHTNTHTHTSRSRCWPSRLKLR
jgi:hypothetical protein